MRSVAPLLLLALAGTAGGQDVRVRVGTPNWSPNGTATTAIAITNGRPDSLHVVPRIDLPQEWRLLTGLPTQSVAGGESGLIMVGLSVPTRAAAAQYFVPVALVEAGSDRLLAADTITVVVPRRRAVELGLLERPNFVVAGRSYDARFLLRNRGNAPTIVQLAVKSSLGVPSLLPTSVTLDANESRVLRVRVQTRAAVNAAIDDILEVAAAEPDSAGHSAEASARVTVVPEPDRSIEEFLKVPARVNIRAASANTVSRFEAYGQGRVRDGGVTRMDFLLRGPTGPFAAFGERDEYRVGLFNPSWRVRAGDQTYLLSSLTGAGQPGFGLGADVTRGRFTLGAYEQQFRRAPEKGSEAGAYLSAQPAEGARIAVNAVERAGGGLPGRVGSATAEIERQGLSAEAEVAGSSHRGSTGLARSVRASGVIADVTYDLGHMAADTAFAGSQRGANHNYLITRAQPWEHVALGFNGSLHRVDLSRSVGVPYEDRLDRAALLATLYDRVTMELARTTRGTIIQGLNTMATQHSARARADQELRVGVLSLEVEGGRARDALRVERDFADVTLGVRAPFRRGQAGGYIQRYTGGSVLKGDAGTTTVGGDVTLQFRNGASATLFGYATHQRTPAAEWHSQLDALVTKSLPNGTSVTLRARLFGGGSLAASEHSVAYLEYGVPLRLPVSRLRTTGRVYGRIVDAVTGQGVPGALVRLGPQVAITDRDGDVAFGSVPAGEHRLSMSQETSFANAVFVDDAVVDVDRTRTRPTTFRVAVARSARVDVDVRRFAMVRTPVAGTPDSLSDAGAVTNAMLVLAGERDTLYRTTSEQGRATFTDIPPGRWTITVRGDAPAFHRFDPERIEVELKPGETRALSFRLVPRKREVQIIGDNLDLKAAPAEPRGAASGTPSGTKALKPNELRPNQR